MSVYNANPDRLWREYGRVFEQWDDLTLGRWVVQTLCQFRGQAWRLSHPLLGAYRLASQVANSREMWQKRLITIPNDYRSSQCCVAPLLPQFNRDVLDAGLLCEHCGETAVYFDELPSELQAPVKDWATRYDRVHAIAHWSERKVSEADDYPRLLEDAAKTAERLLHQMATEILPAFLPHFTAVVWEDQDECLDVQPEDIEIATDLPAF